MLMVSLLAPISATAPVEFWVIRPLCSQPVTVEYAPPTFTAPELVITSWLELGESAARWHTPGCRC